MITNECFLLMPDPGQGGLSALCKERYYLSSLHQNRVFSIYLIDVISNTFICMRLGRLVVLFPEFVEEKCCVTTVELVICYYK